MAIGKNENESRFQSGAVGRHTTYTEISDQEAARIRKEALRQASRQNSRSAQSLSQRLIEMYPVDDSNRSHAQDLHTIVLNEAEPTNPDKLREINEGDINEMVSRIAAETGLSSTVIRTHFVIDGVFSQKKYDRFLASIIKICGEPDNLLVLPLITTASIDVKGDVIEHMIGVQSKKRRFGSQRS